MVTSTIKNGNNYEKQGYRVLVILLVFVNTINALHTLETPIREALLKPRNFNPHPYQRYQQHAINFDINAIEAVAEDYADNSVYNIKVFPSLQTPLAAERHPANGIFSQGPVQFPPSAMIRNNLRNLPHPYATLKYKGELNRSNNQLNEIEHDSLAALPKKQYAFSYTVRDTQSGDDFSHTQQQRNGAVKGTYKVQLPDGRTQVVRYTADSGGYRADVSYLDDAIGKSDISHVPLVTQKSYVLDSAQNTLDQKHQRPTDYINYVVNVPSQQQQQQNTIPSQSVYHHLNAYNTIPSSPSSSASQTQFLLNSLIEPSPTHPSATSSIFVSTAKPPTETPVAYGNHINIELRKSISSQPTYVVSAKSTQIDDTFAKCVPGYECASNTIIQTDLIDANNVIAADLRGERIFIKPQHHTVYYKNV